jgi:peptidoglycan LD-endopeptidase CwlK
MSFDRIDTTLLNPPFFARLQQLVATCAAQGAIYVATSGLRTFDQQTALYAQGRTTPGNIVTNARAGFSAHNYGVAVDFVRDADPSTPGVQPTWAAADYQLLATEAEKLGLEAGAHWVSFKDAPHIQMPLTRLGFTWPQLIAANATDSVASVLASVPWP